MTARQDYPVAALLAANYDSDIALEVGRLLDELDVTRMEREERRTGDSQGCGSSDAQARHVSNEIDGICSHA